MPTTNHNQTSEGKQAQLAPEDEGGKVETSSRLTDAQQTQHQQQVVIKGTIKSKIDDENGSNIDEVYSDFRKDTSKFVTRHSKATTVRQQRPQTDVALRSLPYYTEET